MQVLGTTLSRFDQCVLSMALIHMCDSDSYVGQELRREYNAWKHLSNEAIHSPWREPQQFTIYLPHPNQTYEDITLEEGLNRGYNIEVEPIKDADGLVYDIPVGGHFVVILKQGRTDEDFIIAATGIFVRALGILSLDVIIDLSQEEYQSLVVKHPIIRDYPNNWEAHLRRFLSGETPGEEIPQIVGYVDRALNQDYRPPSWGELSLKMSNFSGF